MVRQIPSPPIYGEAAPPSPSPLHLPTRCWDFWVASSSHSSVFSSSHFGPFLCFAGTRRLRHAEQKGRRTGQRGVRWWWWGGRQSPRGGTAVPPRMCAPVFVGQDAEGARVGRVGPRPDVPAAETGLSDVEAVPLREKKQKCPPSPSSTLTKGTGPRVEDGWQGVDNGRVSREKS